MENTHLLNTNTYSIATTLLQEKVERLEREKLELLNTRNLENDPQFKNRFNYNGSDQRGAEPNVHRSGTSVVRNNFTREYSN
jgi:hypothetical protein